MTADLVTAWWDCCDHCGCGTPTGAWTARTGHDDTCVHGCNDTDSAAVASDVPSASSGTTSHT